MVPTNVKVTELALAETEERDTELPLAFTVKSEIAGSEAVLRLWLKVNTTVCPSAAFVAPVSLGTPEEEVTVFA